MTYMILFSVLLFASNSIHATVIWDGTSVSSVTDENVEIHSCTLQDSVTEIVAANADVTIEVTEHATVNAGFEDQQLWIYTQWPYTVTIKVSHDLTLEGLFGVPTEPLHIYVYGDGAIRWEIADDRDLNIGTNSDNGPVHLWHSYEEEQTPRHVFVVQERNQIKVGKNSSIGFSVLSPLIAQPSMVFHSEDFEDNSDRRGINMHHESAFVFHVLPIILP